MFEYKRIYEVILAKLEAETELRPGRIKAGWKTDEWILAERECAMREVNHQRSLRAYEPLDMARIERAERLAVGHSDYVKKYAHAAADLVLKENP